MVLAIDTRDFTTNRATDARIDELSQAAASVSNQLPGTHTVSVPALNSLPGTPNSLLSTNAPTTAGSLIEQALSFVTQTSAAFGFAPGEPVEFVPDPTAEYVANPNETEVVTDGWGQPMTPLSVDLTDYTPQVLVTFPMPSQSTVLDKGPFADPISAHLVLFYQNPDTRLGWYVRIALPDYHDRYEVVVSADRANPEILYCQSLMRTMLAEGNVYTENPVATPRQLVQFPRNLKDYPVPKPAVLPAQFPGHWCTNDKCIGNNTIATLGLSFPVDCQAIQLIDRPIKLNDRQQISQIDRQNQDNQIHTDFNTQFQLKVGQSAIVKSRNFELIFLGVTEDSRCPADLNCFESGQIKIALKIAIDGRNLGCLNLANNASIKKLSIKQFNNFLIEFVTVRPYPNSNQIIKTPDYIITLIVKKQT